MARPQVGAGVTKAAADADALAQALATCQGDMANALQLFDRLRRPHAAAIVTRARELGAYMQAQVLSAHERELAEEHRKPEAVITETAVPMRTVHQRSVMAPHLVLTSMLIALSTGFIYVDLARNNK